MRSIEYKIVALQNQNTVAPIHVKDLIKDHSQDIVLNPVLNEWQEHEITNDNDWNSIYFNLGYDFVKGEVLQEPEYRQGVYPLFVLEKAKTTLTSKCCGGKNTITYESSYKVYWRLKNIN
jgi:hypothetical protein